MSTIKKAIILNCSFILLLLLSIAFIDRPLATIVTNKLFFLKPFFYNYTVFFDALSVNIVWLLLFSLAFGLLLLFSKKGRKIAFVLLTTVIVHLGASALTNILKSAFKRARPEVYLNTQGQSQDFHNTHTRDYSFPSAHTSFYLSLFLPAALALRKFAIPLLIIPGIIILGRVVLNEHYLSDILCSILIVFNMSFFTLNLFHIINKVLVSIMNKRSRKQSPSSL
jgi:membrane-associated phospholipid phosphatase